MRLACYLMLPLLAPKREQDPAAAPPDAMAGEQPGARHLAQAPGCSPAMASGGAAAGSCSGFGASKGNIR